MINIDDFESVQEAFVTGELKQVAVALDKNNTNMFSPLFVQFYPQVHKEYKLSFLHSLIYGFITYYLGVSKGEFYFTNKQIGNIFAVSEGQISKAIKDLTDKELMETNLEIKAAGGKMRYVRLRKNVMSDYAKTTSLTSRKQPVNKNKINKSIINNTNVSSDELTSFHETFNKLFKTNYRNTEDRVKKLKLRRKIYSLEEILTAVNNLAASAFHQGKNDRNWKANPDFLLRSDEKVDEWLNKALTEPQREGYKTVDQLREEGLLW